MRDKLNEDCSSLSQAPLCFWLAIFHAAPQLTECLEEANLATCTAASAAIRSRSRGAPPPPPPHLILGEKGKMTEGRKAGRASKIKPAPSLAQSLDLPLAVMLLKFFELPTGISLGKVLLIWQGGMKILRWGSENF